LPPFRRGADNNNSPATRRQNPIDAQLASSTGQRRAQPIENDVRVRDTDAYHTDRPAGQRSPSPLSAESHKRKRGIEEEGKKSKSKISDFAPDVGDNARILGTIVEAHNEPVQLDCANMRVHVEDLERKIPSLQNEVDVLRRALHSSKDTLLQQKEADLLRQCTIEEQSLQIKQQQEQIEGLVTRLDEMDKLTNQTAAVEADAKAHDAVCNANFTSLGLSRARQEAFSNALAKEVRSKERDFRTRLDAIETNSGSRDLVNGISADLLLTKKEYATRLAVIEGGLKSTEQRLSGTEERQSTSEFRQCTSDVRLDDLNTFRNGFEKRLSSFSACLMASKVRQDAFKGLQDASIARHDASEERQIAFDERLKAVELRQDASEQSKEDAIRTSIEEVAHQREAIMGGPQAQTPPLTPTSTHATPSTPSAAPSVGSLESLREVLDKVNSRLDAQDMSLRNKDSRLCAIEATSSKSATVTALNEVVSKAFKSADKNCCQHYDKLDMVINIVSAP
jgi:hypothetical protein